jgi:hypothetical protein
MLIGWEGEAMLVDGCSMLDKLKQIPFFIQYLYEA